MESYIFKLTAANRKSNTNFETIELEHKLFSKAAKNCSTGITFKRTGKSISINSITTDCITLTLSATSSLSSPTRTLSAFSRELIQLDKDSNLLDDIIYNHSLFRTELLDTIQNCTLSAANISNPELLKAIIDLLFSPSNQYNTVQKKKAISSLKEIMLPFINM